MKKLLFIAGILLSLAIQPLDAQVRRSHEVALGSLQFKDDNNLEMAFSGAQIEYRFDLHWKFDTHEITYQPRLGFGLVWNRGMIGGQIHIAPINVTWTRPFYETGGHTIRGGANFIADYNYQLTQLNDGTMFYTAEIGFAPVMEYGYRWQNKRINVRLQNSILGFSSHRQGYDPYDFMFTYKDFLVYPHRDLRFGSFKYNKFMPLPFLGEAWGCAFVAKSPKVINFAI